MDKKDVIVIDLDQLAMLMAKEIPTLDCPDCCGPVYEFIEAGARVYREELEWALFAKAVLDMHMQRKMRR